MILDHLKQKKNKKKLFMENDPCGPPSLPPSYGIFHNFFLFFFEPFPYPFWAKLKWIELNRIEYADDQLTKMELCCQFRNWNVTWQYCQIITNYTI